VDIWSPDPQSEIVEGPTIQVPLSLHLKLSRSVPASQETDKAPEPCYQGNSGSSESTLEKQDLSDTPPHLPPHTPSYLGKQIMAPGGSQSN
jgi:hypothetical protein